MAQAVVWKFDERAEQIFIHFDVPDHYLNLETFIQTADSARKVLEALDRTFFNGELALDIIVLPPTEGSFLTRLALVVGSTGVLLTGAAQFVEKTISFVESDVGSGYVESLTGKAPVDWAKDLGKAHREYLDQRASPTENSKNDAEDAPPDVTKRDDVHPDLENSVLCGPILQLVSAMTRGILEASTEALVAVGMEVGDLPDALDARAEFFAACYLDPDVKRVGFSQQDDFPIPRSSFPERAQKPPRKKKEDEEPEWIVSKEDIHVSSPNWNEDKQNTRKWQGLDSSRRERLFVIEDAEFWGRIRRKELRFEGLDSLKVQWAYQIVGGKAKNRRVLRVLEFNNDQLAEPLSQDAINAILGRHTTVEAVRNGPSLFDLLED